MQTAMPQDQLPDSQNLMGFCTRCQKPKLQFSISGEPIVLAYDSLLEPFGGETPSPSERISVLTCQSCHLDIAVIEKYQRKPPVKQTILASTAKGHDEIAKTTPTPGNTQLYWQGVQWWPAKIEALDEPEV